MRRRNWVFIGLLGATVLVIATGCDNLFGDNDDEQLPQGVVHGTLTVSVGEMHDHNDLSLFVAVVETGRDPEQDMIARGVAGINEYGHALVTAREITNGREGDPWLPEDGVTYDVHILMVHTDHSGPLMAQEGNLHHKNYPHTYTHNHSKQIDLNRRDFGGVIGVSASDLEPPEDAPEGTEYYFSAWLFHAGEEDFGDPENLVARSEEAPIVDRNVDRMVLMTGDFDNISETVWVGELGISYSLVLQIDGPHDNDDPSYWWTENPVATFELNGLTLIGYEYDSDDWDEWQEESD